MKALLLMLLVVLPAVGCNRQDDLLPDTTIAPAGSADAAAVPEALPKPAHITPEQWLANPAYKKANPYDLPLEYDIKVPELPPKEVMEPSPELPPKQG